MSVIIQSQFTSAVVEANMDIFTGSYMEGKYTVLEFDMRKRNLQKETGINHKIYGLQRHITWISVNFQYFKSNCLPLYIRTGLVL